MIKLASWNVNGIRAVAKKNFKSTLYKIEADIIGFQETKAQDDQVAEVFEAEQLDYNYQYSYSAVKKGYSGTAILSSIKPISISKGIGIEEHDQEGRVLTAEYDKFYFVTVYVPNSSSGLKRLPYRKTWDEAFLSYLKDLEKIKPVVLCGDMNVAHQPIDLANPKSNYNKTSGYTQQEIDGMSNLINAGFVDTFRAKYPDEIEYSWWSYRFNARAKNIGWRIDYFLVSDSLADKVKEAFIMQEIEGSDHCPVGIVLDI